jgi:hypothetical protein
MLAQVGTATRGRLSRAITAGAGDLQQTDRRPVTQPVSSLVTTPAAASAAAGISPEGSAAESMDKPKNTKNTAQVEQPAEQCRQGGLAPTVQQTVLRGEAAPDDRSQVAATRNVQRVQVRPEVGSQVSVRARRPRTTRRPSTCRRSSRGRPAPRRGRAGPGRVPLLRPHRHFLRPPAAVRHQPRGRRPTPSVGSCPVPVECGRAVHLMRAHLPAARGSQRSWTAAPAMVGRDYCWASHSSKVISPSSASGPGSSVRSLSRSP